MLKCSLFLNNLNAVGFNLLSFHSVHHGLGDGSLDK